MKDILTQLASGATQTIPDGLNSSAGNTDIATGGMTTSGLFGDGSIVSTVINIILYVIGIISVVMLIFGGIKYATSAGDEKKVTSAKNTIIYAIVGLAVAILAWTLVNFVFSSLGNSS